MSGHTSNPRPGYQPATHWIGVALTALPTALVGFGVIAAPSMPVFWVLLIGTLPSLASALISFFSTDIVLHQHRLAYATGVFRRQTYDLPVSRIESVVMEQSLLGRILDYGQVTIIAIGSTPVTTPSIKHPSRFREALQLAMAEGGE
ncbi:Bacterial membrane flanked domain protein [compost metagenome]